MRYLQPEELQIASRYLFLSMAIVVMQQDMQHVEEGAFKIKDPYLKMLDKMAAEAMEERRKIRGLMQRKQIRVVTLDKNDSFSSYLFVCGKREEKRNYFNPAIRKKVEVIVQEFMQKVQLSAPVDASSRT